MTERPGDRTQSTSPTGLAATIGGSGPPVVLLHAFPVDHRAWEPQIERLAGSFRVVAVDLPGFGASRSLAVDDDGDVVDWTIARVADHLGVFLDELGTGPAVVAGVSRGGYVALALARRHPERVAGLVLADTRAVRDDPDVEARWRLLADRCLVDGPSAVWEDMAGELLGPSTRRGRPAVVERVRAIVLDQDPRGIACGARSMVGREDATAALPALDVPALVVAGAEDPAIDLTRQLAEGLPRAEFHVLPQAGHYANLEVPDPFTDTLERFLRSATSTITGSG